MRDVKGNEDVAGVCGRKNCRVYTGRKKVCAGLIRWLHAVVKGDQSFTGNLVSVRIQLLSLAQAILNL